MQHTGSQSHGGQKSSQKRIYGAGDRCPDYAISFYCPDINWKFFPQCQCLCPVREYRRRGYVPVCSGIKGFHIFKTKRIGLKKKGQKYLQ